MKYAVSVNNSFIVARYCYYTVYFCVTGVFAEIIVEFKRDSFEISQYFPYFFSPGKPPAALDFNYDAAPLRYHSRGAGKTKNTRPKKQC